MVLTVSFVLFPVTGLCLPPSSADRSTNLMPASGHQNHTTSPSASAPFVSAAFASTASRAYVRDDRDTPLMWDGMARFIILIWVRDERKYFSMWGWTANSALSPSGKSRRAHTPGTG